MPTYVYECDRGHVFEVEQRMTDEKLTECDQKLLTDEARTIDAAYSIEEGPWTCCEPCRRLIQPTNFVLLGPGWGRAGYSKDSR